MSNGGFPQNQPRPAQPQQPVARTVPQIPIEMQRAYGDTLLVVAHAA